MLRLKETVPCSVLPSGATVDSRVERCAAPEIESCEHKNFVFLPKIAGDIEGQSWLPLS